MERRLAMISQPMAGLTDEEIERARNEAIAFLESEGYEVINTKFTDEYYKEDRKNKALMYLAKSLDNMTRVDAVLFCPGWEKATGCRIEHEAAEAYGVPVILPSY